MLGPDDVVALEATANALAIARIIEPHVTLLANPKAAKAVTGLRAKTDKIDARMLADGFLPEVWTPDEADQGAPAADLKARLSGVSD